MVLPGIFHEQPDPSIVDKIMYHKYLNNKTLNALI